jgi:hypothetical protein
MNEGWGDARECFLSVRHFCIPPKQSNSFI